MTSTIALAACAAIGLSAASAEAATIAKTPHAHRHAKPPAAQPEAAPDPAPASAATPKVIEPDPVQFGHAGSGTKY